ncbi:MAG: cbb3-type cytochrome c oxidase subunit 3 [Betaproteobacteria bacterium]|nr:cbb3-type cytochrome c oxidase subunit 3 [Betaproteobacteria bacterium]NDF63654.1 cbb3-type cytochrome c oxidase subunit 3 [Betaproteobacteria bacterium]
MDITTLRIVATLVSFAAFIGIVVWVLDRRKTQRFEEAARLPFQED